MMARQNVLDRNNPLTSNDPLLVALFIAGFIHIVIVLGVTFTEPETSPMASRRSIDVTLVTTPAKKPPKQAKFLAQDNQVGTGEKYHKPQPPAHRVAGLGEGQKRQQAVSEPVEVEAKVEQKLLTQKKAETKVTAEKQHQTQQSTENRPRLTAEDLQRQIVQYGREIQLKQQSSDESKIKHVSSVSAHRYVAAQYVKDWERKVERTGNMNYPAIAAKKNFSATLTMDVGIKPDGSLHSMRISRSSGYPELDEAAKRIVKMSAPFPALPSDLLKELNVLVITRKWKFSDESGMAAP
jgi:protein TonB